MQTIPSHTGLALVGGGPAMLGLLTAAEASGALRAWARRGVTLVHDGGREDFGAGQLAQYDIRSDTRGKVFVEVVNASLRGRSQVDLTRCDVETPVHLKLASRALAAAGRHAVDRLDARMGVRVCSRTRVTGLSLGSHGVRVTWNDGSLEASQVVLGVGGQPLVPRWPVAPGGVLRHSDDVLRPDGLARLLRGLSPIDPRVSIVGGSHSAFAVAGVLLRSGVDWEPAAITIRHRSPILVTYPDGAAAQRDGEAVRADQVCPTTGIVNRFGGLRSDAADLYRRIRAGDEPRVLLSRIGSRPLLDLVGPADVVVAATGYGSAVQSLLPGARWDSAGRLYHDAAGVSRRVLGLGLGTGRRRDAHTGGEPAFTGSIDGVWFYQNVVAPRLLDLIAP